MQLSWDIEAWNDYVFWQKSDKRMAGRINDLIKDSLRSPFDGIGKPEPLRGNYSGCWSRRIDEEHRLVYKLIDNRLHVLQCRYHYK